jgi:hypothetical protein
MLGIAVYPFSVFEIETGPLKIITPIVNQGEIIFTEITYNKHVDLPSTVSAQLITKEGWIVTSQLLSCNLPVGRHTAILGFQLPRVVNIPTKDDTITAHMTISASYSVFGVRNILVSFNTEDFQIRKNK